MPPGMFHVKQPPQPAENGGEEHQNENGGVYMEHVPPIPPA
jgi:hypothetical protein